MWLSIEEPHDQVWITTQNTWTIRILLWVYTTKWEYQHMDTWPSVNINMEIHDYIRVSTWGYMTSCEYQHGTSNKVKVLAGDPWQSVNSNTGTHKQMIISIGWYMIKCVNTVIHNKVWISKCGHFSKWDYQQSNT